MMADATSTLRYRAPADRWTDALPLGNGRLGAMCFGGVELDRFQLNENTCWSGSPATAGGIREITGGPAIVDAARAALAGGDVRAAEDLLRGLQGGHSQAYQPLADLWIEQRRPYATDGPAIYQRHLDLRSAVASHTYSCPAGRVSQEAWISAGAQALVIRRRVQREKPAPIMIRLGSVHPTAQARSVPGGVDLVVRMPSDVPPMPAPVAYDPAPGAALTAVAGLRVLTAGLMTVVGEQVRIDDADELILVVSVITDYVDPLTEPHGDVEALRRSLDERLGTVVEALCRNGGYTGLRAAHEREHLRLFSRVAVRLGAPEAPTRLDTADRLRSHAAGESDPALAALQFQYGRYLLIAASRPGSLPAGLQGLWNDQVRPPWNGNYTTNINLEMNYWPAEVANLAECHRPLLDWLGYARRRGAEVARRLYGLDGWTLHHNSDAWCFGLPAGIGDDDVRWSFWPLAAAWLSRHVVAHYDYGRDAAFLSAVGWPILRDAAEFCLGWLTEMPAGTLGTTPSTSPENAFVAPDGRPAGASVSTTADLVLIRDLLTDVVRLGPAGDDLVDRARAALPRIPAMRIGADGRLAEWSSDVADAEPAHRHTSHLIGVYPGHTIDPDDTPGLAAAAHRALDARGPESTGWSLAWRIALRARLRDQDGAAEVVRRFLLPANDPAGDRSGVYLNLFCAHPPFQIDGNFGFTAGVAEMLLQSHAGTDEVTRVHLLPALPAEWAEGEFAGLRARGGVTVGASWSHGALLEVRLLSDADRRITVRSGSQRIEVTTRAGVPTTVSPAPSPTR
jgi:alpha-L-fucosidase 2